MITMASVDQAAPTMSAKDFMDKFKVGWTLFGDATTTDVGFPTQYTGKGWGQVRAMLQNDETVLGLKSDILKGVGIQDPVVVDDATKTVIDGHHRVIACDLTNTPVPYYLVDDQNRAVNV